MDETLTRELCIVWEDRIEPIIRKLVARHPEIARELPEFIGEWAHMSALEICDPPPYEVSPTVERVVERFLKEMRRRLEQPEP